MPRPASPGRVVGCSGAGPCPEPGPDDTVVPVSDAHRIVVRGGSLSAPDRRVLVAFAAQAGALLEREQLTAAAEAAAPLAELDRTRTALLAAVSHDLRAPLASAKAAVTSLRDPDMVWSTEDETELLATADESLDRLTRLVANLLDMSRLQVGAMPVQARRFALDDVIPAVLDALEDSADGAGRTMAVSVPPDLPEVTADPPLVERVLVNLGMNALRHSPPEFPPALHASAIADRVEVRVVDRGPGIPEEARERMFAPFQRLGDHDNTTGVGLGLALSRGLAEAMGGSLLPEDTPGGGLTMVLTLPAATGDGAAIPATVAESLA